MKTTTWRWGAPVALLAACLFSLLLAGCISGDAGGDARLTDVLRGVRGAGASQRSTPVALQDVPDLEALTRIEIPAESVASETSGEPRMEAPRGTVLRVTEPLSPAERPEPEPEAVDAEQPEAGDGAVAVPAPPAPVADAGSAGPRLELPPVDIGAPKVAVRPPVDVSVEPVAPELPTTRVASLNVGKEADVTAVLRALARAGNQNILVSKGVEGKITLSLSDIPWDQAFKGVLSSAGLSYTWEGDIIRVMTLEDMNKELEIEKLRQQREEVRAALRQAEPLEMKILKIKYANASNLGESLKALLAGTGGDDSSRRPGVTVDEESNTIIVYAAETEIRKIESLISQLDVPKQQVLIEAKIVEASRNMARQLGVQWGGLYSAIQGKYRYLVSPGAEAISQNFGANFPANLDNDLGITVGFMRELFGGGEVLNLQLSALQEDGHVNILSSPSITTLDNETATIESGEERAYRETSGTGNDLDVSIEWKKAALKLSVTPHIVDERRIRMDIDASKDSFDESKQESNGEFPVNTKNAKTSLLVLDGETTVIGGLSQESRSLSEAGVPFLMKVPLLGHLFKGSTKGTTMDEVLIFITPYILGSSAQG